MVEVSALAREGGIGHHHIADEVWVVNLGQDRQGLFGEIKRLFLFGSPRRQLGSGLKDSHSQPRRVLRKMLERHRHPSFGFLQLTLAGPPVEGKRVCEPCHGFAITVLGGPFQCAAKVLALGSNAVEQWGSERCVCVKAFGVNKPYKPSRVLAPQSLRLACLL